MSLDWRTARRLGMVLAVPVLLSACVPIVTIATTAASGVSYLTTGKTVPDNMLSVVTQRDCRILRGFQGEEVCAGAPETPDDVAAVPAATQDAITVEGAVN